MNIDFFTNKFEPKTNEQLIEIIKNPNKYVLEARLSALTILKNRNPNFNSNNSFNIEAFENQIKDDLQYRDSNRENIIKHLESISLNTKKSIHLKNGNTLQITRLSINKFQLKQIHSKSLFTPIVIAVVQDDHTIKYYPFFNLNGIFFGIAICIVILLFEYLKNETLSNDSISFMTICLIFSFGIQILFSPFIIPTIIKIFKEELSKKS